MNNETKRAKLIWLLAEHQKTLAIITEARKKLYRMGAMDKKGARLVALSNKEIEKLSLAYEAGENYLTGKGLTP